MIQVEIQIVPQTSRERAFAFLSDLENNPKWITGMEWTKKLTDGPLRKGTKLRNRFSERGGVEYDETITSFEPNRSFAFEIHVPGMPIRGSFTFEDVPDGTKISFTETILPTKLRYKLLAPFISPLIKRQLKKDFSKLQTLLSA